MTAEAEVFSAIRERLSARLHVPAESITLSSRLTEDLGVDSLTAVELLIEIEDRFGVIVADEDRRGLAPATAIPPIEATGCESKIGIQMRPASIDFQTPPFTAPK